MLLSEQEDAMLRRLAKDAGVNLADVVRGGIRRQHEARYGRGDLHILEARGA
jgi:hypothetical protein